MTIDISITCSNLVRTLDQACARPFMLSCMRPMSTMMQDCKMDCNHTCLPGTFACLVVTINYRIRVSTRMLSQGGCNSAGRIPPLTHHHLISLEKVPTKTIAMKIVQKLKSLYISHEITLSSFDTKFTRLPNTYF